MPDKFDEMAKLTCQRMHFDGVFCDQCNEIAAALRSTDAKAREEERERCAGIAVDSAKAWSEGANDDPVDKERALRYRARAGACALVANRIRDPEPEAGGEECGTEPLYTFTADGSEGSPPAPGFEEACRRGDVFPLKPEGGDDAE